MYVSRIMSRKLIAVSRLDKVEEAVKLLRRKGVRHLLVMDKARLVGIISDRDIKRAMDPATTKKRVMSIGGFYFLMEPILIEEIMTGDPVTIDPETSVAQAARLMVKHRFGALPVVEAGQLVGIVTETDLLKYFAAQETN